MSDNEIYEKLKNVAYLELSGNDDFKSLGMLGGLKYMIFKRPLHLLIALAVVAALIFGIEYAKSEVKKLWKVTPIDQAEAIVKKQLKSPSSFKKIKGEELWSGIDSEGMKAHVVSVSFEANNSFGASLKGCMVVAFSETKDHGVAWNTQYGVEDYSEMVNFCDSSTPSEIKMNDVKVMVERNFKDTALDHY